MLKKEDTPNTIDYEEDTSPGARVSGCKDFWHSMEAREKLSVVSYITDKTKMPPVFITHGTKDFIINTDCSVQLYKKLKECGKDARLFIVKGAIHSDPAFWTEELIDYMDEFIKYCLEKNRDENQGDQQ